MAEFGSSNF
jgi:hypothetical protein